MITLIDKIALNLGEALSKYIGLNKVKETELVYFLKRIIKNLIFYTITFNIAIKINLFIPILIILLTYNSVRIRFGGVHLKNQTLCLISSIIIPLVLGYIASVYNFSLYSIIIIFTIIILYANYVGVVDNINRPLTVKKKQKFKKQGLVILVILFVINILVYISNLTLISNSICLGVLLEGILLIRIPKQIKKE